MKKSSIKKMLAVAAIMCLGCMTAACSNIVDTPKDVPVVLVNFEDETISVGFGENIQLELQGYTEAGKPYGVSAVVKNSAGETVDAPSGKFVVTDRGGYTIVYTYAEQSRTVTLTVGANKEPVLTVDGGGAMVLCNVETYKIPECNAYDYYDGELEVTTELYQKQEGGDVIVDYDEENRLFTPTESGEYYVLYSTENSAGKSVDKEIKFYGYENLLKGDPLKKQSLLKVDSGSWSSFYNQDVSGRYVPADSAELAAIKGDYHGAATKMEMFTNPGYRMKNDYSMAELVELSKEYSHVSLWFAVTGIKSGQFLMMTGNDSFFNKMSSGGGHHSVESTDCDVWQKWTIKFSDYVQLVQLSNYESCKLFYSYREANCVSTGNGIHFYFGDVEFFNYTPNILEVTASTASNVYLYNGSATSPFEYYAAENLTHIAGDYTGNAVGYAFTVNNGFRFRNPYTVEELQGMKANGYTKISLWFALDREYTYDGGAMYLSGAPEGVTTFMNASDFADKCYNDSADGWQRNTWYKIELEIDKYITTLSEDGTYCNLMGCWEQGGVLAGTLLIGDIILE